MRAQARSCTARRRAITHDGKGVFAGLPKPFTVTRYHSLAIERDVAAGLPGSHGDWTDGRRDHGRAPHASSAVEGVQFHPESILTEHGHALLKNFLTTHGMHAERSDA